MFRKTWMFSEGPLPKAIQGHGACPPRPSGTPLSVELAYGGGETAAKARVRGGKRLSMRGLRVLPGKLHGSLHSR